MDANTKEMNLVKESHRNAKEANQLRAEVSAVSDVAMVRETQFESRTYELESLRAEVERWELAFQEQYFRAERAEAELSAEQNMRSCVEAELATERARLDWLEGNAGDIPRYHSRSWIWIAHQNLREKIDAAMKEGK